MLSALDHALMRDLYAGSAAGAFGLVMVVATWAGSGWSMLGIIPLLIGRNTRRYGLAMLVTLLASAAAAFALKAIIRRPRPFMAIPDVIPLSGAPSDFSFPSGHATGSATFATFVVVTSVLALRSGAIPRGARPAVVIGCVAVLAFAVLVAASRVYLGVHYPGDVVAGALLGAVIGTTGACWYGRSSRATSTADREKNERNERAQDVSHPRR